MLKSLKVLRLVSSLIFIVSGFGHLVLPEHIMSQLGKNSISQFVQALPLADLLVRVSGLPLLVLGLLLLFNLYTRYTTLLLMLMTSGITLATHIGLESMGPLVKNLIIMASLNVLYENKKMQN